MFRPVPPHVKTGLPLPYTDLLERLGLGVPLAARQGAEGIRPALGRDEFDQVRLDFKHGKPARMEAFLILEGEESHAGAWAERAHLLYLWRPQSDRVETLLQEPGPIVFCWREMAEGGRLADRGLGGMSAQGEAVEPGVEAPLELRVMRAERSGG